MIHGTHEVSGFADVDDAITIEARSNAFETYTGAKGEVTRAMINDETVLIKVKLQQTSKSVAYFQNILLADRASGNMVLPIQVDNYEEGESIKIPKTYVIKQPTITRGKGQNIIEVELIGDREIPIFIP